MTYDPFLEALAKPEPVPGGGAAAAHGAAAGFALLEKVVRLELQRQPLALELQLVWEPLLERVCGLAETVLRLRDEDGGAYMRFAEARASGKAALDVEAALEQAVESPLKIMETGHDGLSCASQAGKHCRKQLLSDLLVVCELLGAATRGAYGIAQANLLLMADSSRKDEYLKTISRLRDRWDDSFRQVERSILARAGLGSGGPSSWQPAAGSRRDHTETR